MTKVYVGLSGGVDSSVAAAVLKQQGYDVTGVYMKNWSKDLPGFPCPWKQDYHDAKRVAVQLKIPFKIYDFERQYKHLVVDYMISEYKKGRTPNPDVMCNQEVKFKLFLKTALSDGADFIATGHYARVNNGRLLTARNKAKDQTYFLYRVKQDALKKSLFPIGEFTTKDKVRHMAKNLGLVTASKGDSQGICFVGQIGIREFLSQFVKSSPGSIIDSNNKIIGEHDGAIFYTIGQRHGLNIGGGLPYYVTGKNMKKNELYVTTDLDNKKLWHKKFTLTDLHWINKKPELGKEYQAVVRYRAPMVYAKLRQNGKNLIVELKNEIRAITPGQSTVVYADDKVIGGGIVT